MKSPARRTGRAFDEDGRSGSELVAETCKDGKLRPVDVHVAAVDLKRIVETIEVKVRTAEVGVAGFQARDQVVRGRVFGAETDCPTGEGLAIGEIEVFAVKISAEFQVRISKSDAAGGV